MTTDHETAQERLMEALVNIEDADDGRDEAILCILEGLFKYVPVDVLEEIATMVEKFTTEEILGISAPTTRRLMGYKANRTDEEGDD